MTDTAQDIATRVMVREKNRVALTSVVAAVLLTSTKLGIGLWTGSLGILSEAAHSGLDLLAALITYFAVRVADRPPDEDHPFGHGKVENLSALAETILLLITCAWILYEAYNRLVFGHREIEVNVWSFIVILLSIVVDFTRSRALYRVARKYHSQALEADALHFSTDIYSSVVVIIGLIAVSFGFQAADPIAASIVAIIVISISLRLGRRTIDVLLDSAPVGVQDSVRSIVQSVPGVASLSSVRTRAAGARTFVDVVIGIERNATFDQVHGIMDAVEGAVGDALPRSEVIVHAEPVIAKDEMLKDSLRWLVSRAGLTAHNILILDVNGQHHVEMDIEYPVGTSFEEAHEHSRAVQGRITTLIPTVRDVSIHIEEETSHAVSATDVTEQEEELTGRIRDAILPYAMTECSSIRLYLTDRGINAALSCRFSGDIALTDMHDAVNGIERTISALDTRIVKVFIHAEPS